MITNVYIFTSRGDDWLSNAIALGSAPVSWMPQLRNVPSHTGLMFEMESGKKFYFETHTPDGWKGPKPVRRLEEWERKGSKRWVRYRELDLSPSEMEKVWDKCHEKLLDLHWQDYREFQIVELLVRRFTKARVKQSPSPVCSEAVAKILFPYFDLRIWNQKRRPLGFDELTPWHIQVADLRRLDSFL